MIAANPAASVYFFFSPGLSLIGTDPKLKSIESLTYSPLLILLSCFQCFTPKLVNNARLKFLLQLGNILSFPFPPPWFLPHFSTVVMNASRLFCTHSLKFPNIIKIKVFCLGLSRKQDD